MNKNNYKPYETMLYIEWDDSQTTDSWQDKELTHGLLKSLIVKTVAFYVGETETHFLICMNDIEEYLCMTQLIPKICIKKIKEIK